MSFIDYSFAETTAPYPGDSSAALTAILSSDSSSALAGDLLDFTLSIYGDYSVSKSDITLNVYEGELTVSVESTQSINDSDYLIQARINGAGQGQLTATVGGVVSNGVFITLLEYPSVSVPKVTDVLRDYDVAIAALKPTSAAIGTTKDQLANNGKVQPSVDRGDKPKFDSLPGATQEATSRLAALSESLGLVHLASELASLQTWVSAQGTEILTDDLSNYQSSLSEGLVRLGLILEKYSYSPAGSDISRISSAYGRSAQSFRFNSGSVFDVYAPATLLNTEYLVQQSSKGTFRQTAIDQLSCFYSWERSEESIVQQAKDRYEYTTEHSYVGGKQSVEVFESGDSRYGSGLDLQVGDGISEAPYNVSVTKDINFFSQLGSYFLRVLDRVYSSCKEFVVEAVEHVFLKARRAAIEGEKSVDITVTDGKLTLRADDIVFVSKNPVRLVTGEWPLLMEQYLSGMSPTQDPELRRRPALVTTTLGVEEPTLRPLLTSYVVSITCPMEPIFKPVVYPVELLEYPKSGLPKDIKQPFNGAVAQPVSPSYK